MIDSRLAALQCTYTNVHRDTEKRKKPYTVHDFASYLDEPEKQQDDSKTISQRLRAFFGGVNKVNR